MKRKRYSLLLFFCFIPFFVSADLFDTQTNEARVQVFELNLNEKVSQDPASLSSEERTLFENAYNITPETFYKANQQGLISDEEKSLGNIFTATRAVIAPETITDADKKRIESDYGVPYNAWLQSTDSQRTHFKQTADQNLLDSIISVNSVVDKLSNDPNSLSDEESQYLQKKLGVSPSEFSNLSQEEQEILIEEKRLERAGQFRENVINNLPESTNVTNIKPQPFGYTPLPGTDIPGLTDSVTGNSFSSILSSAYEFLIGFAAVLAVVMIFYAGFRYTTTSSSDAKSEAKARILAAIGGLLLALSSWLILNTIDSDLVGADLIFSEFNQGKIEFELMTREGFEAYRDRYNLALTYSEYQQTGSLSGGATEAGFGGLSGNYSSYGTSGARFDLKNTYYYVAYESDYPGGARHTVKKNGGGDFGKVSHSFCVNLDIEGTGILKNGVTINFAREGAGTQGQCTGTTRHYYEEVGPSAPFGYGNVGKNPLRPFRSAAVDNSIIPKKSILFIPQTKGMQLPNGGTHDGYWVADDTGSRIRQNNIDLFIGKKSNASYLHTQGIKGDKIQELEAYIVGRE